jgi:ribosome maturation factor RimP
MDRQGLIDELSAIIGDFLKQQNLDLVELIYRYEGRDLVLRILVDKPEGGITLDECAYLNNEISAILDEKDLLQQRYILEVSSPGLDRPLKSKNDFLRCINKRVKVFLNEPIKAKLELEGIITEVKDHSVYIDISAETIEVPLSKITKAKQVIVTI